MKEELVSLENYEKAYNLFKDIDENDIPFVALSLEIDSYLLTGDEKLKKALRKRGFNKFLSK